MSFTGTDQDSVINYIPGNVKISDPKPSPQLSSVKIAVRVRNVCLSYGENHVLNGLSLNVPEGTIYGLLGPSGGGKTSLLKLIIGLSECNHGHISVFGYKPGTAESGVPGSGVGYMPQEIALETMMTIGEMLLYFGRLHMVNEISLSERIDYLVKLLELPESTRLIQNLSGGQQRRVSLAATIIHKPRLVILDEPTVGVDPILCKRIWEQLVSLSTREKMTIMITTHYIEETKRAHVVGFMRKGQILAEESPQNMLIRFNVDSLEKVFYHLCIGQKARKSMLANNPNRRKSVMDTPVEEISQLDARKAFDNSSKGNPLYIYCMIIQVLVWKYFIQTMRQPGATLSIYIIPSYVLLFNFWCLGGTPKNVPVGWVNMDITSRTLQSGAHPMLPVPSPFQMASNLTESATEMALAVTKAAEIDCNNGTDQGSYSSSALDLPEMYRTVVDKKMLNLIDYPDMDSALKALVGRKLRGIVYFGPNFSTSFIDRSIFLSTAEWVDNSTVDEGTIHLKTEGPDQFIAFTIRVTLETALNDFYSIIAPKIGRTPQSVKMPIELGTPIYGSYVDGDLFGLLEFASPAFMITIVYLLAYSLSTMSLVTEITDSMFERNYSTGLTSQQIIFGQLVARGFFLNIACVILLSFSVLALSLPCRGSFLLALALLFQTVLVGMTHGLLTAAIFQDHFTVFFMTLGQLLFFLFMGGVIWPAEGLPYYLYWFSRILPYTNPADSLRGIMVKVNAPFVSQVLPGFAINTFWLVFYFIAANAVFARKK